MREIGTGTSVLRRCDGPLMGKERTQGPVGKGRTECEGGEGGLRVRKKRTQIRE